MFHTFFKAFTISHFLFAPLSILPNTEEWKEKNFTQQLDISWTSKVIYEVHRKMLRLYSNLGILWNLHITFCILIIISLKSSDEIFSQIISSIVERLKAQEEKESTQKLNCSILPMPKTKIMLFFLFWCWSLDLKAASFHWVLGIIFQTRYVLIWGSSFQWSWWRSKSCCMKSRLKWNARWSWEKPQVLLDLQRNSIEVGGPGVG